MKNILLLTVIIAVGVAAFIYYRKKTSNGAATNPPIKMPDAVVERPTAVDMTSSFSRA
jgi:uncharacterized protein YxeA